MSSKTNLLRLQLADRVAEMRTTLNRVMAATEDKRSGAVAVTKLDELEMWADRALPPEPEPKVSMGATDDPRGRS